MSSSSELVCTFVTKKKLDYKKLINSFSKIQNTNEEELNVMTNQIYNYGEE